MKHIVIGFLFFFLIADKAQAQPGMYSESDIATQTNFIEALAMKMSGKFEKEIELLEKILVSQSDNDVIYYELAIAYWNLEKLDLAAKNMEKALSFNPNQIAYWQLKSDIEEQNEDFEKRTASLEKLIGLDPDNREHYKKLFNNAVYLQEAESALSILDREEKIFGFNKDLANRRIEILKLTRDLYGIEQTLVALSNSEPKNIEYLLRVASFYKKSDNIKAASKYYARVLELDPDNPVANLANVGGDIDKVDESTYFRAIKPLIENENIELDAKIKELIPYISKMPLEKEDNYNVSLYEILTSLKNLYPKEAKVHSILGDYYFNSRQLQEAKKEYKTTISLRDNVFPVWEQLMRTLYYTEDFKQLALTSEQCIDLFPNQSSAFYYSTLAAIYGNNMSDVDDLMEEGLLVSTGAPEKQKQINSLTAHKLFMESKADDAMAKIEELYGKGKITEPEVLKLQGDIMESKKELNEAVKYWNSAFSNGFYSSQIKEKIDVLKS